MPPRGAAGSPGSVTVTPAPSSSELPGAFQEWVSGPEKGELGEETEGFVGVLSSGGGICLI